MADGKASRVFKRKRFTGETFKLRVGANVGAVEEFSVHEVVLKETSRFFQAAVKKEWKEGSQRAIDLPEDTAETVSAYVDWLYYDQILPQTEEHPNDKKAHGRDSNHLAELYVFGEKIQDDSFCDAVIIAFTKHLDRRVNNTHLPLTMGAVETMMAGTSRTSPGRRFIVQVMARRVVPSGIQENSKSLEAIPGLLIDIVAELMAKRDARTLYADLYPQHKQWLKKK